VLVSTSARVCSAASCDRAFVSSESTHSKMGLRSVVSSRSFSSAAIAVRVCAICVSTSCTVGRLARLLQQLRAL